MHGHEMHGSSTIVPGAWPHQRQLELTERREVYRPDFVERKRILDPRTIGEQGQILRALNREYVLSLFGFTWWLSEKLMVSRWPSNSARYHFALDNHI